MTKNKTSDAYNHIMSQMDLIANTESTVHFDVPTYFALNEKQEKEMTKVYVVESGEYSDRCIEGIFSTRELAEKFISFKKSCQKEDYYDLSYHIEEFDIDWVSKTSKQYTFLFDTSMNIVNETEEFEPGHDLYETSGTEINYVSWHGNYNQAIAATIYICKNEEFNEHDKEVARKIACDMCAEFLYREAKRYKDERDTAVKELQSQRSALEIKEIQKEMEEINKTKERIRSEYMNKEER